MGTGTPDDPVPDGLFQNHWPQHTPQPAPYGYISPSMANMMGTLKEEMNKQFKDITGVDLKLRGRTYQKPYPEFYDLVVKILKQYGSMLANT